MSGFIGAMLLSQAMGGNSNPATSYLVGRSAGLSSSNAFGLALMNSNNNQESRPAPAPMQAPTPSLAQYREPARITYATKEELLEDERRIRDERIEEQKNKEKRENTERIRLTAAADRKRKNEDDEIDEELKRTEKRKRQLQLQLEVDDMTEQLKERNKELEIQKRVDKALEKKMKEIKSDNATIINLAVRKALKSIQKGKQIKIPMAPMTVDVSSDNEETSSEEENR